MMGEAMVIPPIGTAPPSLRPTITMPVTEAPTNAHLTAPETKKGQVEPASIGKDPARMW